MLVNLLVDRSVGLGERRSVLGEELALVVFHFEGFGGLVLGSCRGSCGLAAGWDFFVGEGDAAHKVR